MAYEYKKLSEVDVVNSVDSDVNLIVEQNDKIKKMNIGDLPIPTGQVQADWNEEDGTKPSFIKNKPDLSQVGGSGGGEVIVIKVDYSGNADWTYADGTAMTPETLRDKFEAGAIVYVSANQSGYGDGTDIAVQMMSVIQYAYVPQFLIQSMVEYYTPSQIELYYYGKLWGEEKMRRIILVGETVE